MILAFPYGNPALILMPSCGPLGFTRGGQDQQHMPQRPVGGAAAGTAAGRLVQHRGIEQPRLYGQRTHLRQLQPAGVSLLQPQLAVLAKAHASQQPTGGRT